MIYDCFTFFNELDLLEIRLNTLDDVVDRFVIAEATRTHSGKPKELLFEKNKARYAKFLDKIEYVVVDDLLPEEEVAKDSFHLPWVNENRQRNALIRGLAAAKDADIVMVSDLDEIPRPEKVSEAVKKMAGRASSVRFGMDFYCFYANFRNYSYPEWLLGTSAVQYGTFHKEGAFDGVTSDRYKQASENIGNTLTKLRFLKSEIVLRHAGWHFSYLGGIEAIRIKLTSFAHAEYGGVSDEQLKRRLESGSDLFGRAGKMYGVPIDQSFPKFLVDNRQRFASLIFDVDGKYLRQTWLARRIASARGLLYKAAVALVPTSMAPLLVRMRDKFFKRFGRI